METQFTYHWLHIPTGKEGEGLFVSKNSTFAGRPIFRLDQLELINKWNGQAHLMKDKWVYWL